MAAGEERGAPDPGRSEHAARARQLCCRPRTGRRIVDVYRRARLQIFTPATDLEDQAAGDDYLGAGCRDGRLQARLGKAGGRRPDGCGLHHGGVVPDGHRQPDAHQQHRDHGRRGAAQLIRPPCGRLPDVTLRRREQQHQGHSGHGPDTGRGHTHCADPGYASGYDTASSGLGYVLAQADTRRAADRRCSYPERATRYPAAQHEPLAQADDAAADQAAHVQPQDAGRTAARAADD